MIKREKIEMTDYGFWNGLPLMAIHKETGLKFYSDNVVTLLSVMFQKLTLEEVDRCEFYQWIQGHSIKVRVLDDGRHQMVGWKDE